MTKSDLLGKCRLPSRGLNARRFFISVTPMIFAAATLVHGQGNVSVGTNIPPMSRGPGIVRPAAAPARSTTEDAALVSALARFNATAKAKGEGTSTWEAISAHANVPSATLRQQRASTKMNPGELLLANSLTSSSGNAFAKILALRTSAGSWTQLAKDLRTDPARLTARLNAADASLKKEKTKKS